MKQTKLPKSKKKSFSSFDLASAYKQLGIKTLTHWNLPDIAIALSAIALSAIALSAIVLSAIAAFLRQLFNLGKE